MPSSRILTELWRKATTSFKNMEQGTEDDGRLPNRAELRNHQETIQDIIDVFVATQQSNAAPVRFESASLNKTERSTVPMISPSETSSAQSFFPIDTSRATNNRFVNQTSPILKRKVEEMAPNTEPEHPHKIRSPSPTTFAEVSARTASPADPHQALLVPKGRKRVRSKFSLMTPEDDAYIWKTYLAHKSSVNELQRGKNNQAGLAKRIAAKLNTNWQSIGARLKVLKVLHGEVSGAGQARVGPNSSRRDADVNSLEGGGIDGGRLRSNSNGEGASDSSSNSSSEEKSSGSESEACSACSKHRSDHTNGRGTINTNANATHTVTPACSLHSIAPLPYPSAAPPRPNTSKKHSPSERTQHLRVAETPLSPPPHIARKTTFTHEDDVVLWNEYLRNGCEVPTDRQLQKLVQKLNRNSTSGVAYRINRLVAEDHKVSVKDTHPVFTTSHDEYILCKYNSNKALRGDQQQSQEVLCDNIAQKLKVEPVRVKYRLLLLLQSSRNGDDNHSDSSSSTTSSRSASSSHTSESTDNDDANNSPLAPRTANRYTESEDMAIYTAYLSNSVESKRKRALDEVAVTLGRSKESVHARLDRLFEDQRAVATARSKGSANNKTSIPGRRRGRPRKARGKDDETQSDSAIAAVPSVPSSIASAHKLSVGDLSCLPSFNPATPHAGFVSGVNTVSQNTHKRSDSNIISDTNSLDDSDTDRPITSTNAHGATTAMRQQLKNLSDSSSENVQSDDYNTQKIEPKPRSDDKVNPGIGRAVPPPPAHDTLCPPVIPSVPTTKQTTPAALAAGARLVGARVGASDAQPTSSTSSTSRSQHRTVTISNNTAAQQGMDILYPQTVHDQVLAIVLGCLQHLHIHNDTPTYSSVLDCLQRCLRRTAHTLPRLKHVTNAQLRSVIVLLQRAECVVLHGGPHVNTPITMRLAGGMRSFLDMR
eukprot:gene12621-14590_t